MISVDSNILARFYIATENTEDQRQQPKAARIMASGAVYVTRTALLEFEWLLRTYKIPLNKKLAILSHLAALQNVTIESSDVTDDALHYYAEGMDFADALHLAASQHCASMATFDTGFKKIATRLGLKPPCIIPA